MLLKERAVFYSGFCCLLFWISSIYKYHVCIHSILAYSKMEPLRVVSEEAKSKKVVEKQPPSKEEVQERKRRRMAAAREERNLEKRRRVAQVEAAKSEKEEWRYPAGDEDRDRPHMGLEDGGSGGGCGGAGVRRWIRMWMWRRRMKRCGSRGGIGAGGGGMAATGGRGGGGRGGSVARQRAWGQATGGGTPRIGLFGNPTCHLFNYFETFCNSHYQYCCTFSRGFQPKPAFATGILGRGKTQDIAINPV